MQRFFLKRQRGQSLVELALVLPFCLWTLLGMVDFGRVYYGYVGATNAAREGARYWAATPTATIAEVRTRVKAEAAPQLVIPDAGITLSSPAADQRQVEVQLQFTALTPMISGLWGGGPLSVTTRAVMPTLF